MIRTERQESEGDPSCRPPPDPCNGQPYGRAPAALPGMRLRMDRLSRDLADRMTHDGDVESFRVRPDAFRWRDGLTGIAHRFVPDFLVGRPEGTLVYRLTMSSRSLVADPSLGGRRNRIELECHARGADFEIWTEREIGAARGLAVFARAATSLERQAVSRGQGAPQEINDEAHREKRSRSLLLAAVAHGLSIPRLYPWGTGWVGRSDLTGIAMALLCDLETVPNMGALRWAPSLRRARRPGPGRASCDGRRLRPDRR